MTNCSRTRSFASSPPSAARTSTMTDSTAHLHLQRTALRREAPAYPWTVRQHGVTECAEALVDIPQEEADRIAAGLQQLATRLVGHSTISRRELHTELGALLDQPLRLVFSCRAGLGGEIHCEQGEAFRKALQV